MIHLLLALMACGSAAPQGGSVGQTVPDPRAYVRDAYVSQDASWAGRSDYNLTDPAIVDEVIDKAVKTRRRKWKGELPNDQRELDSFIRISKGMYNTAILSTDERRAMVEQRVRDHFANPPIRLEADTAIVDLGWAPGKLEKLTRAGYGIGSSDQVEDRQLKPDVVRRVFSQAHAAHPGAAAIQFEVMVPMGTRSQRYTYRYDAAADRLYVREVAEIWVSKTQAGGIQALIDGSVPTHTRDLVGADDEARFYEMRK